MAKLIKLDIKDLPSTRIVGKIVRPNMDMQENPIPAFWSQCFADGTFTKLEEYKEHHLDASYVGWMGDWNNSDGKFTYLCGMLMQADAPVPEGFVYRDVPQAKVAIGWVKGLEKEVYSVAHPYTQQALEERGYKVDEQALWCMELYACPRFTQPDEKGEIILDYYIPCQDS